MTAECTILMLNSGRRIELLRAFRRAFEDLGIAGRIVSHRHQRVRPQPLPGRRLLSPAPFGRGRFPERTAGRLARERVSLIVPSIDPDLPVLARERDKLMANGEHGADLAAAGDRHLPGQAGNIPLFGGQRVFHARDARHRARAGRRPAAVHQTPLRKRQRPCLQGQLPRGVGVLLAIRPRSHDPTVCRRRGDYRRTCSPTGTPNRWAPCRGGEFACARAKSS